MTPAEACMARALEMAARGRGTTAPNPCVGAVLECGGAVVAEGWHQRCGGPHAEVNCLADAAARGVNPADCTLYVTLEPCNHHGKTPPCTQAILAAGVKAVAVGCADPNPVAGGGADFLRSRGVDVTVGLLEQQCRDMIADFVTWRRTQRPYVTLKLAMTLDGKIAAPGGRPEAVSGPQSHRRTQELRAYADAVMVGGGTLRADNPRLGCRLETGHAKGRDWQPAAVIVTTRLPEADAQLYLLQGRANEAIFLTSLAAAESPDATALRGLGCRVWGLPDHAAGGLDLALGLTRLRAEAGAYYLLCEGGGRLAMSLTAQGLADEIRIFLAPRVLGDDRAPAGFSGRGVQSLAQALDYRFADVRPSGADLELTLRPQDTQPCSPA